jgi:hypothetical protein
MVLWCNDVDEARAAMRCDAQEKDRKSKLRSNHCNVCEQLKQALFHPSTHNSHLMIATRDSTQWAALLV